MRTPEANERLFNSPSEGEVFITVADGKITAARYRDEGRDGEPKVGSLSGEFKQNDGPKDPVGTAPPLTPDYPPNTHKGPTTALSGHEVEGFPNEEIPEKGIDAKEATELAVEKGVPEAVIDEAAEKQREKLAAKGKAEPGVAKKA